MFGDVPVAGETSLGTIHSIAIVIDIEVDEFHFDINTYIFYCIRKTNL